MPADDRDRLFEKALARQLRAEAGAGDAACLDAETLAAYHERLLAPDEMMSAKSHIVSCARCQEILAQLEMTQGVQESLEQEANVAPAAAVPAPLPEVQPTARKVAPFPATKTALPRWAAPAGAIAAGILIWVGVRDYRAAHTEKYSEVQIAENRNEVSPTPEPPAAAPQTPAKEKSSATPSEERQQEQNLRSSNVLRDDAPVSGSANRPQPHANVGDALSSRAELASPKIMAKAAPDAATSATGFGAGVGASGAAPARKKEDLDAGDKIMAYTAQNKAAAQDSSASLQGGIGGRPAAPLPPPPSPSRTAGSSQLHGTVTDPSGAAIAGASVALQSEKGSTVASTSTDTTGTYSFDDVAAGNYHLELQSTGFQTDRIIGLNVAPGDNVVDAKLQVGTATETVEVTAQAVTLNTESTKLDARQKDEKQLAITGRNVFSMKSLRFVAASPDGKNIWRFGDHGGIAHSRDGGKTWESQVAPASVAFSGGSAPSNKICWIAGAAGTLLRTTDRGKHWQLVSTPITADLGGVQASDAKHATIWDVANRIRYETSDGGLTWRPVSNQ
jgi:hypothetical protein